MTPSEVLLGGIFFMLIIIWIYIRWIYLRVQYEIGFDKPVNQYGENISDAIQNGIVRGNQGISTWQ